VPDAQQGLQPQQREQVREFRRTATAATGVQRRPTRWPIRPASTPRARACAATRAST